MDIGGQTTAYSAPSALLNLESVERSAMWSHPFRVSGTVVLS